MRFLIVVKASIEPDNTLPHDTGLAAAMAEFRAALARDGALLDAASLAPSSEGWRIRYSATGARMETGPFDEAPQGITAYALIQARSRDDAVEWTRRFPNPITHPGGASRPVLIEVHPVQSLADQALYCQPEPDPQTRRQP